MIEHAAGEIFTRMSVYGEPFDVALRRYAGLEKPRVRVKMGRGKYRRFRPDSIIPIRMGESPRDAILRAMSEEYE